MPRSARTPKTFYIEQGKPPENKVNIYLTIGYHGLIIMLCNYHDYKLVNEFAMNEEINEGNIPAMPLCHY